MLKLLSVEASAETEGTWVLREQRSESRILLVRVFLSKTENILGLACFKMFFGKLNLEQCPQKDLQAT